MPPDAVKLYELIWRRTVASQCSPAEYDVTKLQAECGGYCFKASGRVLTFDGFLAVYQESSEEDNDKEKEDDEQELPLLAVGDTIDKRGCGIKEKTTKAPGRYTEASLVKKLEALGIGRPSTYASIISILKKRSYIELVKKKLAATGDGERLMDFVASSCLWIAEFDFTKTMEEQLDEVEAGNAKWTAVAEEIYRRSAESGGKEGKVSTGSGAPATTGAVSEKALSYAVSIAKRIGVELPEDVRTDRVKLSKWIDANKDAKAPASAGTGTAKTLAPATDVPAQKALSEKQMFIVTKHAPKDVQTKVAGGDIVAGRVWLDSYFSSKK